MRFARLLCAWCCVAGAVSGAPRAAAADWATARGNPQRTGNVDGRPGPLKGGKVLWTLNSTDNFVAAPSPGGALVYAPALGGMQTGVLHALAADPAAAQRTAWSRSQPHIKLPTVCAPAVVGGKVYFGDGMHQNKDPSLYCLDAATGRGIWQIPFPGDLYHIEGTPTVVGDRVFVGAGHGGVICVDGSKLTLDGKEVDAAALAEISAKKWKELQDKYEADKKKDPDFAVPPNEDQLPKPQPRVVWRQGEEAQVGKAKVWHVDSPLAVAGDKVLAGSAFLEDEGVGDKALHCLAAADGKPLWRTELKLNPWAGATVAGDLAVVGCSSIRFDPKLMKTAKGEVVAVSLADGSVKWRKEVPGGVVSPAAFVASKNLILFTATDKRLYALDAKTGEQKWVYEGKAPFLGGAAVAGDLAYAADLNGVLQTVNLADGKLAWRLDIGRETKAPGEVFGTPTVQGGRLYLGTCNLEMPNAKTVVVCVGEK